MTKEIALKIKVIGEPVLRRKAKPVKCTSAELRDILSAMARLMYAESGIGLAAPQVGINERMIVVDMGTGLYKLLNPKITKREGRQAIEEGCLSVPGICVKVRRARKVTLKAQGEDFKPVTIEADGLLACVFQHEIDHLNGKLIVDYAPLLQKLKIKDRLKKLKKKTQDERVPESKGESGKLQL